MDLPKGKICGYPVIEIRNLLQRFLELESDMAVTGGELRFSPKRMNADFLSKILGIDSTMASDLVACLRGNGYLEQNKDVPTPLGMALAASKRRPRISRARADKILKQVLECAVKVNARPSARVIIMTIDVFGSYLSKSPDVGDLDILLKFAMPEYEDLKPEDYGERDRISRKLGRISAYVSLHDEFDYIAAGAPAKRVFESP